MAKFNASKIQKSIIAALQARKTAVVQKETDTGATLKKSQGEKWDVEIKAFENPEMLRSIEALHALEYDFNALIEMIPSIDAGKNGFVAIYAFQKIRKAIPAIAAGIRDFDKYSNSIIHNLCNLQKMATIHAQQSICNKIELSAIDECQMIKRLHNCSPNTATTQSSSTREMLRILNVCAISKNSKGDIIAFNDNAIAQRVRGIYAN